MKKKKKTSGYSLTTLIIVFSFFNSLQGQDLNMKYSWSYPIDEHGTLVLENYNCDVEIIHSNSGKIDFEMEIIAEGGSEEDINIIDSYFKNYKFNASSGKVELSTIFYKSETKRSNTKIILDNNETVTFNKIHRKAYLKIPKYIKLEISTKYSDLDIPDVEKIELNSYKDKIEAGNIKLPAVINAKYSEITFHDISDCQLQMYNCELEAHSTGILELKSKYSRYNIADSKDITIDCYNDKYKFKNTGNVHFSGKYSDFISLSSGDITIDAYKCYFESGDIKSLKIKSTKYSEYRFASAINLVLTDSYNDKFVIDKTGKIEVGNSKYSEYLHNTLEKSFSISDGYKNKITINKTSQKFSYFDTNGKYDKIRIGISSDIPLKLDIETKYGSLNYNNASFETKSLIKDDEYYKLNALRYTETENMPLVKIRGYKEDLSIIDIIVK